jgi:hypothetical protein
MATTSHCCYIRCNKAPHGVHTSEPRSSVRDGRKIGLCNRLRSLFAAPLVAARDLHHFVGSDALTRLVAERGRRCCGH